MLGCLFRSASAARFTVLFAAARTLRFSPVSTGRGRAECSAMWRSSPSWVNICTCRSIPTRPACAARLAFATCLALDFDLYLIDEVTEVGDQRFRQKCAEAFRERMQRSDIILVTHNIHTLRQYCDRGAILANGELTLFDDIDDRARSVSSHGPGKSIMAAVPVAEGKRSPDGGTSRAIARRDGPSGRQAGSATYASRSFGRKRSNNRLRSPTEHGRPTTPAVTLGVVLVPDYRRCTGRDRCRSIIS